MQQRPPKEYEQYPYLNNNSSHPKTIFMDVYLCLLIFSVVMVLLLESGTLRFYLEKART